MSAYDNTKALFDSLNKMFPPSPLNSTDMNFGPSPENTATEPTPEMREEDERYNIARQEQLKADAEYEMWLDMIDKQGELE